jgi:putative methionine-R-sulfoxide reductase with GAF domain
VGTGALDGVAHGDGRARAAVDKECTSHQFFAQTRQVWIKKIAKIAKKLPKTH